MSSFVCETRQGIPLYRAVFLEERLPIGAFFSTRIGGVSLEPYTSMNLGLHVGDAYEAVITNRKLLSGAVGIPLEEWVAGEQVHGSAAARVDKKDAGRGSTDLAGTLPGMDAIVTGEKRVALAAFFADCVPVYLVDPVKRAVGLAHAGWKGTVQKIGSKVVKLMVREFGSCPDNLVAAIGPSIGPCCYQVDKRVAEAVREKLPWGDQVIKPDGPGHFRLDLPRANLIELIAAGLKAENVGMANLCTCCQPDVFFSYRASRGLTGRQAAILFLR